MIRSHKNHSIDEVPPPLNGKPGDPSKRYPHLTHLEHQVNQILSQSIAQCDSKSSIQNIFEIGPKTEYIHLTNKFKPWVTNNSLVCNPGQGETACMKIKDEGSKQLLMIFIRDPQVRNYLNEKYPNHSSEVPTAFKYIKALSD